MIILSIDSSTPVASVAIVQNEQLLGEYMLNTKNTHSQKLMGMIARLLEDLSLSVQAVDVFAVAQGPGSFTGLRIGMATAKGLAQGAGKRLIAIPELDALAYNLAGWEGLICPILNAKKNEVYTALYTKQREGLEKLWPAQAIKPLALAEKLQAMSEGTIWFLGDGVAIYRELLTEVLGQRAQFAPPHHLLPRAATVGLLAVKRAKQGTYDDYFTLEPLYIRQSEAEVQWEAKQSQIKGL